MCYIRNTYANYIFIEINIFFVQFDKKLFDFTGVIVDSNQLKRNNN